MESYTEFKFVMHVPEDKLLYSINWQRMPYIGIYVHILLGSSPCTWHDIEQTENFEDYLPHKLFFTHFAQYMDIFCDWGIKGCVRFSKNDTMNQYLYFGLLRPLLINCCFWLLIYVHVQIFITELINKQHTCFLFRLLAFCVAGIYISIIKQQKHGCPLYKFSFCSFSNIMSSWFQYEALKFVSFPTQVWKILIVLLSGSGSTTMYIKKCS